MKKAIYIFIAVLMASCSSNSDDGNTNDGNSNNDNDNGNGGGNSSIQISNILNDTPETWDDGTNFYYDGDRLEILDLGVCSGAMYYYQYSSDGKVSNRYTLYSPDFEIGVDDPELAIIGLSPEVYHYEAGRLVEVTVNGMMREEYTYDSQGRIEEIVHGSNRMVFEYDGEELSEILHWWLYSGTLSIFTLEFDDGPNPAFDQFSQIGVTLQDFCRALNLGMGFKGCLLFDRNITRVMKDGELYYMANYYYGDNGYPERVLSHNYFTDREESEYFVYR